MLSYPLYTFCVDTDTYAGSFERQLCAYVTGEYGECEVGLEIAEKAKEELEALGLDEECEDAIEMCPDNYGTLRPVSIGPTPGWWNDGYGHEFPDSKWKDRVEVVSEAFRKDMKELSSLPESLKERFDKGFTKENIQRYDAMQTVEIYFSTRPSDRLFEVMKKRCVAFSKDYASIDPNGSCHISPFKILRFRLVKSEVKKTQLGSWVPE